MRTTGWHLFIKDRWNKTTSLTVLLGRWSGGHDVYDGTGEPTAEVTAGLREPSWSGEFKKWFPGVRDEWGGKGLLCA